MQDQEVNPIARSLLEGLQLGTARYHANMAIFPLFCGQNAAMSYTTLTEALAAGTLTVTEVDEGGSVPELAVVNTGDLPVLLLDGEELAGAKQNRVLNTTILVKKKSKTIIPVSCTEQGRWAYASAWFEDSGVIMHRSARLRKNRSVSHCLASQETYRSDQGEVWDSIEELQHNAAARSSTGAMRDVFSRRESDLQAYLAAFPPQDAQKGLLVLVNGMPAGFDYVSAESAYTVLHSKLLRSYSMDAVLARKETPSEKSTGKSEDQLKAAAAAFLDQAARAREHRHKSIGHGWDHRFNHGGLVGSALQYRKQVVHMAFFADDGENAVEARMGMAALNRRRNYRRVY